MNDFVCSICGHEQDSMDRKCDSCDSVRVVKISVIENIFGKDWRKSFENIKRIALSYDYRYPKKSLKQL